MWAGGAPNVRDKEMPLEEVLQAGAITPNGED